MSPAESARTATCLNTSRCLNFVEVVVLGRQTESNSPMTKDPGGTTPNTQTGLKRAIGVPLLFAFIVGDTLGAGIYTLVGTMAADVGGAIWNYHSRCPRERLRRRLPDSADRRACGPRSGRVHHSEAPEGIRSWAETNDSEGSVASFRHPASSFPESLRKDLQRAVPQRIPSREFWGLKLIPFTGTLV